jgi:hypothetical protein
MPAIPGKEQRMNILMVKAVMSFPTVSDHLRGEDLEYGNSCV